MNEKLFKNAEKIVKIFGVRYGYLVTQFIRYLDNEIDEWTKKYPECFKQGKVPEAMCYATLQTLKDVKSFFLELVDECLIKDEKFQR